MRSSAPRLGPSSSEGTAMTRAPAAFSRLSWPMYVHSSHRNGSPGLTRVRTSRSSACWLPDVIRDVLGGGGHVLAGQVLGNQTAQPGQALAAGVAQRLGALRAQDVVGAPADEVVRDQLGRGIEAGQVDGIDRHRAHTPLQPFHPRQRLGQRRAGDDCVPGQVGLRRGQLGRTSGFGRAGRPRPRRLNGDEGAAPHSGLEKSRRQQILVRAHHRVAVRPQRPGQRP